MNRLARHGGDYKLSENFCKVALKQMVVGQIEDNFEIWQSGKLPSSCPEYARSPERHVFLTAMMRLVHEFRTQGAETQEAPARMRVSPPA